MRLDADWLERQGEDASLLRAIDTCFDRGLPDRIGIAVSGGGDSMALLHLFQRWSVRTGHAIAAVTVDHRLRDESTAEAGMVGAACARMGIPHDIVTWRGWDGAGNLQAAAREARYRLIAEWARTGGIGGVALGHTADDVAETFLMRLARRSGLDGLAAMAARFDRKGITWVRPLLRHGRAELRGYLSRHCIAWVDDPANDDPRFDRTRARQALAALAPLGIDADGIAHSAVALTEARSALEHHVAEVARDRVTEDRGDLILVRRPPAPVEVERKLMTAMLQWVGGAEYPPRWTALTDLQAALQGGTKAGRRHTLAGCVVTGDDKSLRVTREHAAVRDLVGVTTDLWDGRWRLDGPHGPDLRIRALGSAVKDCPGWRDTGLPRVSLLASPAVWRGRDLIAAPLVEDGAGWTARIVTPFMTHLLWH